jgi:phosphoribosylformimino-5-aminoimidazole carboxamide ribonucleotide (ProFAR) isomerase
VTFSILPALDVWQGRLAVATSDGVAPVDAFDGDPVAAAGAAVALGATALHLVDLDLAFGGSPRLDVAVFRAVAPGAILQVSGGIGDAATGRSYLDAGADRFVLGSSALADDRGTLVALRDAGPRVVVGIEVDGGRIRARGAGPAASEGLDLMSTLGWLHAAGAPAFLVTSVDRVGGLSGPDIDLVRRVARAGRPTFAAWGVRSIEDLRRLRAVGAAGAVVGRAALEARIDLGEALAWAGV